MNMKFPIAFVIILLAGCSTPKSDNSALELLYDYDIEERLVELGIDLSDPQLPPGLSIELAVQSGNLIYLSGNGPILPNGDKFVGKVGTDLTIDQGYEAARITAINQLSVLKAHIGDLNKVEKIVKVLGMVNAEPSFTQHPAVINGFSDLMIEVFGERGRHARSAVGMTSLPWNLACEVELIVQIRE